MRKKRKKLSAGAMVGWLLFFLLMAGCLFFFAIARPNATGDGDINITLALQVTPTPVPTPPPTPSPSPTPTPVPTPTPTPGETPTDVDLSAYYAELIPGEQVKLLAYVRPNGADQSVT